MIKVGLKVEIEHTIDDLGVREFARISGDNNPIHLDEEFAQKSIFGCRIAQGLFVASFISAAIANNLPGPGSIYIAQNLSFKAPVFVGTNIKVVISVTEIKTEKHIAKLCTQVFRSDGTMVIDGDAVVKVPE